MEVKDRLITKIFGDRGKAIVEAFVLAGMMEENKESRETFGYYRWKREAALFAWLIGRACGDYVQGGRVVEGKKRTPCKDIAKLFGSINPYVRRVSSVRYRHTARKTPPKGYEEIDSILELIKRGFYRCNVHNLKDITATVWEQHEPGPLLITKIFGDRGRVIVEAFVLAGMMEKNEEDRGTFGYYKWKREAALFAWLIGRACGDYVQGGRVVEGKERTPCKDIEKLFGSMNPCVRDVSSVRYRHTARKTPPRGYKKIDAILELIKRG